MPFLSHNCVKAMKVENRNVTRSNVVAPTLQLLLHQSKHSKYSVDVLIGFTANYHSATVMTSATYTKGSLECCCEYPCAEWKSGRGLSGRVQRRGRG